MIMNYSVLCVLFMAVLLPFVAPLCNQPRWNSELTNADSIPIKVTLSPPIFNKANSPRMSVFWDTRFLFDSDKDLCDYRMNVIIILKTGQKYNLCLTSTSGCTRGLPEGLCESGESELRLAIELPDKFQWEAPFAKTLREIPCSLDRKLEIVDYKHGNHPVDSKNPALAIKTTTTTTTIATTTTSTTTTTTTTTLKVTKEKISSTTTTTTTTPTTTASKVISSSQEPQTIQPTSLSCMTHLPSWNKTISTGISGDTFFAKWRELSPELCLISEYILEIRGQTGKDSQSVVSSQKYRPGSAQSEDDGFIKAEIPLNALSACKNFTFILRAIESQKQSSLRHVGNFSVPCAEEEEKRSTSEKNNGNEVVGGTPQFQGWPTKPPEPSPTPRASANLDSASGNNGAEELQICLLLSSICLCILRTLQ